MKSLSSVLPSDSLAKAGYLSILAGSFAFSVGHFQCPDFGSLVLYKSSAATRSQAACIPMSSWRGRCEYPSSKLEMAERNYTLSYPHPFLSSSATF